MQAGTSLRLLKAPSSRALHQNVVFRTSQSRSASADRYLVIRDFRQKRNKKGQPYGWPRAEYTTPEALWGAACIAAAYATDPAQSREKVFRQIQAHFPAATEERLRAVLGGR